VHSDPLAADHAEAKAKVGQRVMALRRVQAGTLGDVIAAELPIIYCGGSEGSEQLADPTVFIEWEGRAELVPLSLEEYRQDVQEV
jgi:hypothetical protein